MTSKRPFLGDMRASHEQARKRRGKHMTSEEIKTLRRFHLATGDIFWKIHAVLIPKSPDGPLVRLEWGWTAGMTNDQLRNYADDAPAGHASVTTKLEFIKELRDNLNKIIDDAERS